MVVKIHNNQHKKIYKSSIIYNYNTINNRVLGIMARVFANGPGDRGSIPGQAIPKTFKRVRCLLA